MPPAASPLVSVIMPVYNGATFLDRALDSLRRQTFAEWEAICVDDASTDASATLLARWATDDPRVRVFRHPANRGVSAARNTAIGHLRGSLVAYLDHDDEFYPDHLARAWADRDRGDVLVFRYDQIEERAGHPDLGRTLAYDPARRADFMFHETVAVPLGVVHSPRLFARAGTFDETLERDVDGDLWRRFVRAGAKFAFLPTKSGLYHVRPDSLSRVTPLAAEWTVHVGPEGDRQPLVVPAGEAWRVHQLFDRYEYGGLPAAALRTPPVVLDVGANVGTFAAYAKLTWHRDATVHCFEPFPRSLELLRRNIAPFAGVTVHPVALGRGDTDAELHLHPTNSGAHSLRAELVPTSTRSVSVQLRDAGAVWDELGLTEVDVLKLDAEGCEVAILESLGERLRRVRAVLAEFHTPADRRRLDALLPGHELIGASFHSHRVGVVKYVRADLLAPPVPARSPEPTRRPVPAPRPAAPKSGQPRVLFASSHCYHDPASGAAVCTRDLFAALAARGWECEVVTGPRLDDPKAPPVADALRRQPGTTTRPGTFGGRPFTLFRRPDPAGFPVTVVTAVTADPTETEPVPPRTPSPADVAAFRAAVAEAVTRARPNVLLTYGGDPASRAARKVARDAGVKVMFWLHNFAYTDRREFADCDAVVVPSEFSRQHHKEKLGLDCVALPPVIDPARVLTDRPGDGRFVTFVNPEAGKGLFWFARLAETLGRSRPDIRFLVVEGRGKADALATTGLDWTSIASVRVMANTADPRRFYRLTRLLVMPSAWRESFGRVAAEAMLNGIPVIASDRGALPETVGDGGLVLPLPAAFTPATRIPPTADEVRPWADALTRLWDDHYEYRQASERAKRWAERWQVNQVAQKWENFFTEIIQRR